jgi:hypothetical protein
MIDHEILARLAAKWDIDWEPKYRRATCADCGQNVHKMWHCWFKAGGYFKEIHLCRKCYKKWK